MSIAVVIPGMGRRSLGNAVASVVGQLNDYDQLIVEMDHPLAWDGGNCARDAGAAGASASHLWFLDDDDVALPGAIQAMRDAIAEDPRCGWIFQVETCNSVLPQNERIAETAGCQCLLVPNPAPAFRGRNDMQWYDAIQSTIGVKWRKAVIARLGVGKSAEDPQPRGQR